MFIRRTVLEEIGLFDERFFLNYEETELAWRASKADYKCMILPEAKIIHYSGKSFTDLKLFKPFMVWTTNVFKLTQSRIKFFW
ncbi:MAG: hypothetical protein IPH11_16000 [Ignavibacteriales bacterium]|nr:hypothetical protein [Ignavibacteriales bacterium]